ncbi:GGDEF domain-containing protein [Magnetofaba australis]|uniref:diguanylate cyclase n=1 Tax=Magnetofaba australis IT-1 TaxID=1434232 RepID=A0A1Y2K3W0_9PROT|nr:GGDEF domain-containing protein [Magnetofaba australis]OSM02337.1 putative GGDEF domain-containing protein [Magnetofaba australis IT-1]
MNQLVQFLERWMLRMHLSPEHFWLLLAPNRHTLYFNHHRAAIISTRVRIASASFALLTLLWIPVDMLLLPEPGATIMALLRACGVGLFVYLAWPDAASRKNLARAQARLGLMLMAPTALYLAAAYFLAGVPFSGPDLVLAQLYKMLPFVVISGLCLFPLTLIESVLYAIILAPLFALGVLFNGDYAWESTLASIWIFVLLLGVFVMAGVVQLFYMFALVDRVSYDPLTKAFSRRSGQDLLDLYYHIAESHDRSLAIGFVDLDNFKSINDTYGHEAGDEALKQAVEALKGYIRQGDMIVRWGGEEFLLLLPNADIRGVRAVLERITEGWLGLRPDGQSMLTASIGLAERKVDGAEDWESLVELADQRMYEAKNSGKARAVSCNGEVFASDLI